MYIQTNLAAINLLRNYHINYNQLNKSMERLSTGYRINRAADDAAGLAISENMRFQINGLKQASRNITDGISLIQTAEGAMNEVHAMLQRMNVLANQASNGIYSEKDREKLQFEFSQLREEILHITKHSNFNGIKLLNGDKALDPNDKKSGLAIQAGYEANDVIMIDMPNVTSSIQGIMNLDISTESGARSALEALKESVENISMDRAKLGAYQNRLEHRNNYVLNVVENLSASHSRIRDADMALEMMNMMRSRILTDVSTTLLAQANAMSRNILKLLEAL